MKKLLIILMFTISFISPASDVILHPGNAEVNINGTTVSCVGSKELTNPSALSDEGIFVALKTHQFENCYSYDNESTFTLVINKEYIHTIKHPFSKDDYKTLATMIKDSIAMGICK